MKHLVSLYLDPIFSDHFCVKHFYIFCPNLLNWSTYIRQAFLCLECLSLKITKDKEGCETDSLTVN